jgi:hypothetical protein
VNTGRLSRAMFAGVIRKLRRLLDARGPRRRQTRKPKAAR